MRAGLAAELRPTRPLAAPEWRVSSGVVPYPTALAEMNGRATAIASGHAPELIWLLEHPPLYTAGTSSVETPVGAPFPLYAAGRGGQLTYHGPGQRVVYVMLDLRARTPDVRRFVASLEQWLIDTLGQLGVRGERREDRIGVWVARPDKGDDREDKIAAIGVRVRRWVSLHGVSLNVEPDLAHFARIVPCGISDPRYGVTSLADMGKRATMAEVDAALRRSFDRLFGPVAAPAG